MMVSGVLDERRRCFTHCRISSGSPSPTTTATTRWPHSGSATPITAASLMPGQASRTSSISAGAMFSPPRMMVSSARPSMNR